MTKKIKLIETQWTPIEFLKLLEYQKQQKN